MEQLLLPSEGGLRRELSTGTFFVPVRTRSTCSGDLATESSSTTTFEDVDELQSNCRRITLCKQVLLEATTNFNAAPLIDSPVLKSPACRNSGALLPLLNMLAAEQDPVRMARCLDTLSFLLLDRGNRRACLELRALDILLDILRRATDQQVLHSALEALCCLCKHDPKDKMALWHHPSKGALLSMLSSRYSSQTIVETLRTCRTLCFAAGSSSGDLTAMAPITGACCSTAEEGQRHAHSSRAVPQARQHEQEQQPDGQRGGHHHHNRNHHAHGLLQLLEPGLLTVTSELLHPSTDTEVLLKALKLLHNASAVVACAVGSPGCCGCWHNAVFRVVPLLTHCADVEVVDAALGVLVNLSEHDVFHNMFFASGCIPPLLHLLSHKRCHVSQSASCVLSALAEGGLSRDKLCQDTALLAMLRVVQTNHCVVVTLGVLYMLGRLAAYRAQVVRSLKNWGAVPLLLRLLATTHDEDAAEGCRQLLQALGVQAPPLAQAAAGCAANHGGGGANPGAPKLTLHAAYSSIAVFGGPAISGQMPMTGINSGNAALCRTISAAATVAAQCATEAQQQQQQQQQLAEVISGAPGAKALLDRATDRSSKGRNLATRLNHHSSFRFYGGPSAAACGPVGPLATAVAPAAAY